GRDGDRRAIALVLYVIFGCAMGAASAAVAAGIAATAPTMRVAGGPIRAPRARPGRSPSVPTTTRSSGVVAHWTTAEGSERGRPAAIRVAQRSSSLPAAIRTARVSTAASIAAMSTSVEPAAVDAVTTAHDRATPRGV